jgi:hypothetical protein
MSFMIILIAVFSSASLIDHILHMHSDGDIGLRTAIIGRNIWGYNVILLSLVLIHRAFLLF